MMNDTITLLLSGFAGLLLGAIFFGGLWWTVQKGITAKQPALWFLGSMFARMSVVIGGFYLVSDGHWQRLLVCLMGFIGARLTVLWLTRPTHHVPVSRSPGGEAAMEPAARIYKESSHAT